MAADEPIPVFTTVEDAHPLPAIAAREAYVISFVLNNTC